MMKSHHYSVVDVVVVTAMCIKYIEKRKNRKMTSVFLSKNFNVLLIFD